LAKKVQTTIKLQIPAGSANPAPPVGPALGQHGVNIMEFCKAFNAQTQKLEEGLKVPVIITAFADRTFTFVVKTPPAPLLVLRAAGLKSGSKTPGKGGYVGKITKAQVEEIAKTKLPDLNTNDLEAAMRTVEGSARSMGIEVVA